MQQFKIIRNERKGKFNLEISSDFNAKKKKKKRWSFCGAFLADGIDRSL